eukprot:7383044-Prymnesium_polylepis.1
MPGVRLEVVDVLLGLAQLLGADRQPGVVPVALLVVDVDEDLPLTAAVARADGETLGDDLRTPPKVLLRP